jgi:hypothetical protein
MTPLCILVGVPIWVMGQARCSWSAHGLPWNFSPHVVAKLLCSCLCLLDATVKLHAMDGKKCLMNLSLECEHGFYM